MSTYLKPYLKVHGQSKAFIFVGFYVPDLYFRAAPRDQEGVWGVGIHTIVSLNPANPKSPNPKRVLGIV